MGYPPLYGIRGISGIGGMAYSPQFQSYLGIRGEYPPLIPHPNGVIVSKHYYLESLHMDTIVSKDYYLETLRMGAEWCARSSHPSFLFLYFSLYVHPDFFLEKEKERKRRRVHSSRDSTNNII